MPLPHYYYPDDISTMQIILIRFFYLR